MASFFESLQYTPQEIAAMKSKLDAVTPYHQGMGIGLNVAQNLSPSASFGFLLGNILGNRINNYMNVQRQKEAHKTYQDFLNRLNFAQNPPTENLFPNWMQQNQKLALKYPSNQGNFLNWAQQNPNQPDFLNWANKAPSNLLNFSRW